MKKIMLACSIALFTALLTPGQGTGTTAKQEYVPVVIKNRLTNETKVKYVPLINQEQNHQVTTSQLTVPVTITNDDGEEIKLESLPLKDQEYIRRVQKTAQSVLEPELGGLNPIPFSFRLLQPPFVITAVIRCDIVVNQPCNEPNDGIPDHPFRPPCLYTDVNCTPEIIIIPCDPFARFCF